MHYPAICTLCWYIQSFTVLILLSKWNGLNNLLQVHSHLQDSSEIIQSQGWETLGNQSFPLSTEDHIKGRREGSLFSSFNCIHLTFLIAILNRLIWSGEMIGGEDWSLFLALFPPIPEYKAPRVQGTMCSVPSKWSTPLCGTFLWHAPCVLAWRCLRMCSNDFMELCFRVQS